MQLQPHMPLETASKLATLLQGDGVITVAEYQAAFPTITVELRRQVRDKTGQSLPSLGMARMTEDEARVHTHFPVYGTTTPQLVRASVEDTDNEDDTWSPGDFITLTFDMPTNRAAEAGDKAFVDRLFRIEPSIGTDYSGEWLGANPNREPTTTPSPTLPLTLTPTLPQASGRPTASSASRRSTRWAASSCCATTPAVARTRPPTPRSQARCAIAARPRAPLSRARRWWGSATPGRRCSRDSRWPNPNPSANPSG